MGSKNNSWMSFSDLMTGLMVIFMFVAISYILEVQKAEQQRQKVVTDFQDSKSAIYKDLRSAFDEEKKKRMGDGDRKRFIDSFYKSPSYICSREIRCDSNLSENIK